MQQDGDGNMQLPTPPPTLSGHALRIAKGAYRRLPGVWAAGVDLKAQAGLKPRAPTRLDVMTSFGGGNADVVQVMVQSLSDSHPHDQIAFWLLEQNIPAPQIRALSAFCDSLGNVTLHPLRVPDAADFDRLRVLGGKPDSARFLWFVAHQLLPPDLERVIYLDAADIIVSDDLAPLLRHPFLGRYLVACRERPDLPPLLIGPARRACGLGMPASFTRHIANGLINSGAIVLNLNKFRRDGIGIAHYLQVAEWAHDRLGLTFGDQGLFSLTHGSHYALAHDRYNHRFHNEPPGRVMQRPAVLHFAGRVLKPVYWRLTPAQERRVTDHLTRTGQDMLQLDHWLRLRPAHMPYLRRWWEICARTPSHARIAPQAGKRMTEALARLGIHGEGG